jgi:hypothetical protein
MKSLGDDDTEDQSAKFGVNGFRYTAGASYNF